MKHNHDAAERVWKAGVQKQVTDARRALIRLLEEGPMDVSPQVLERARAMTDVEVLSLKYELRDFLRAIAKAKEKP